MALLLHSYHFFIARLSENYNCIIKPLSRHYCCFIACLLFYYYVFIRLLSASYHAFIARLLLLYQFLIKTGHIEPTLRPFGCIKSPSSLSLGSWPAILPWLLSQTAILLTFPSQKSHPPLAAFVSQPLFLSPLQKRVCLAVPHSGSSHADFPAECVRANQTASRCALANLFCMTAEKRQLRTSCPTSCHIVSSTEINRKRRHQGGIAENGAGYRTKPASPCVAFFL